MNVVSRKVVCDTNFISGLLSSTNYYIHVESYTSLNMKNKISYEI